MLGGRKPGRRGPADRTRPIPCKDGANCPRGRAQPWTGRRRARGGPPRCRRAPPPMDEDRPPHPAGHAGWAGRQAASRQHAHRACSAGRHQAARAASRRPGRLGRRPQSPARRPPVADDPWRAAAAASRPAAGRTRRRAGRSPLPRVGRCAWFSCRQASRCRGLTGTAPLPAARRTGRPSSTSPPGSRSPPTAALCGSTPAQVRCGRARYSWLCISTSRLAVRSNMRAPSPRS